VPARKLLISRHCEERSNLFFLAFNKMRLPRCARNDLVVRLHFVNDHFESKYNADSGLYGQTLTIQKLAVCGTIEKIKPFHSDASWHFHFFSLDEKKRNKEKSSQNKAGLPLSCPVPLFCRAIAPGSARLFR
jgi:hypothetical protein